MIITAFSIEWWLTFIGGSTIIGAIVGGLFSFSTMLKSHSLKVSADIRAKSRIEWIRDVRNLSTTLMTDFRKVEIIIFRSPSNISEDELQSKLDGAFIKCRSDMDKLVLYFSYNKDKKDLKLDDEFYDNDVSSDYVEKIHFKNNQILEKLNCTIDNNDKNELMVEFIKNLLSFLFKINSFEIENNNLIDQKDIELDKKKKLIKENNVIRRKNIEKFNEYLSKLSKFISIYLKIEWDIAKKGK